MCDLWCEHGFATNPHTGCEECTCNPDPEPPACPDTDCYMPHDCEQARDVNGCYLCECAVAECPPPVLCFAPCPDGSPFMTDDNGCQMGCQCPEPEPVCEPVRCRMRCEFGWAVDEHTGCEICSCADPPIDPPQECRCPIGRRMMVNPMGLLCDDGFDLTPAQSDYTCPSGDIITCGGPAWQCFNEVTGEWRDEFRAEDRTTTTEEPVVTSRPRPASRVRVSRNEKKCRRKGTESACGKKYWTNDCIWTDEDDDGRRCHEGTDEQVEAMRPECVDIPRRRMCVQAGQFCSFSRRLGGKCIPNDVEEADMCGSLRRAQCNSARICELDGRECVPSRRRM